MRRLILSRPAVLLAGAALAAQSMGAGRQELPDRLQIGADRDGGRCIAVVSWTTAEPMAVRGAQPYAIQCGGSAQPRGQVQRRVTSTPPGRCGAPSSITIEPLGAVEGRRCVNAAGVDLVALSTAHWFGYAELGAAAPLVNALAMAERGRQIDAATLATTDGGFIKSLAAAPTADKGTVVAPAAIGPDADAQIRVGLQYIYAGRNVDASHMLNDAVPLLASASAAQRARLRLVAALADSNIGDFGEADQHLRAAAALIAGMPPSDEQVQVASQLPIYRALHLVNQGRWAAARDELAGRGRVATGLRDPATLAQLNRIERPYLPNQFDPNLANTLILDAQADIALSTALMKLGQLDEGQQALGRGVVVTRNLEALLSQYAPASVGSINWLRARLERQHGRLLAARGDRDGALASFDCAVADLQAAAPPAGATCLVPAGAIRGQALGGPTVADAQLERAAILEARRGSDRAAVTAAYAQAVDTLAASPDGSASASPLLGRYLDLLLAAGDPSSAEKFFRALQTVRQPGVARQYAALQQAVATPGEVELRRRINEDEAAVQSLGAQIAALPPGAPTLAGLEAQRAQAAADATKARDQLNPGSRFASLNDAPVTLAELQARLRPHEAYWRLARIGNRLFGAVVTDAGPTVYAVRPGADEVAATARAVVRSARVQKDSAGNILGLRPFQVARSYDLFAAVAGPAAERLRQAQRIAVDDADSLAGVPAAILVTQTVAARADQDYSRVPFLARGAELSTALSPRAFLLGRAGDTSRAPRRLIGFGDNAKAPEGPPDTAVRLTFGCTVPYALWRTEYNRNDGIPTTEISAAAVAIGDPAAPIVSGPAFTDLALRQRSESGDLARYQVVHFATHGSTSVPVPSCDTPLPPALLTSIAPPTSAATLSPSTGWLSYIDIASLRLDANVVVLAACDTTTTEGGTLGRLGGQNDSGSQLDGLIRAFILARARAVVATYWEVPVDAGTQPLMEAFYKAGRTQSLGTALHEGQLAVLNRPDTSHPYYWGAFFLVGDGAKPMFSGPVAMAAR